MSDFVFKKKFGQNFISDTNLLLAIASDAGLDSDDEVLEIGAGAGSLTQILSQKCKKVISFEIDNDLKDQLLSLKLSNVEFCFEDFMNAELSAVEKKFGSSYKVVANLPYYITTPIIFKLLENATKLESLTIMVQKEVAERICAGVGGKDYGILTVMTNFYGTPKITRNISRKMFYPEPNVDSALVNIKINQKYPNVDRKKFLEFIKTAFSMRRKTLLNNLGSKFDKNFLKEKLDASVLQKRPEQLSLEQFVEIFETITNKKK